MSEALKPCPFCGQSDIYNGARGQVAGMRRITCLQCGGQTESIEAWNRRATFGGSGEAVEAALKEAERCLTVINGDAHFINEPPLRKAYSETAANALLNIRKFVEKGLEAVRAGLAAHCHPAPMQAQEGPDTSKERLAQLIREMRKCVKGIPPVNTPDGPGEWNEDWDLETLSELFDQSYHLVTDTAPKPVSLKELWEWDAEAPAPLPEQEGPRVWTATEFKDAPEGFYLWDFGYGDGFSRTFIGNSEMIRMIAEYEARKRGETLYKKPTNEFRTFGPIPQPPTPAAEESK